MTHVQAQLRKALIDEAFIAAHNELMDQHKAGKHSKRDYERAANKINKWAEAQRTELAMILFKQL